MVWNITTDINTPKSKCKCVVFLLDYTVFITVGVTLDLYSYFILLYRGKILNKLEKIVLEIKKLTITVY